MLWPEGKPGRKIFNRLEIFNGTVTLPAMSLSAQIIECDFNSFDHRESFVMLLNEYIKDDMGGGEIIKGARKEKILSDMGVLNRPAWSFSRFVIRCAWEWSSVLGIFDVSCSVRCLTSMTLSFCPRTVRKALGENSWKPSKKRAHAFRMW